MNMQRELTGMSFAAHSGLLQSKGFRATANAQSPVILILTDRNSLVRLG